MPATWPRLAKLTAPQVIQPDVQELREPLLDLWHRNLPSASPERFEWLYGTGRARAWLLSESDGPVIGSAGLMRRTFLAGGGLIEGGAAIDLNVDATRRAVGPALTLARAVIQSADSDGLQCLYGLPIESASAVLKRAGYRQIGKITNWTKLLRSETKLRQVLKSSLAAKLAAPFVDAALRLSSTRRHRFPAHLTLELANGFNQRFDRLFRQAAKQFDIVGERTAEFLSWRFSQSPEVRHETLTLADRASGELLGYVVWHRAADSICISDFLAADQNLLRVLLSEVSRFARRGGANSIRLSCFATDDVYQQLKAAGFSRRQDSYPVLVRTSKNLVEDNWYLTMADHDTDV